MFADIRDVKFSWKCTLYQSARRLR